MQQQIILILCELNKPVQTNVAAGVSSGLPNIQIQRAKLKKNYKYEPPYGYGGNLSTNISPHRLDRRLGGSMLQDQYYNFMDQISLPVSNSRSHSRAPYNGHAPSKSIDRQFKPDPNLNIKPIEKFAGNLSSHTGKKRKESLNTM